MARSRTRSSAAKGQSGNAKERNAAVLHGTRDQRPSSFKPRPTPASLLAQATTFLHTSQPDDALPLALRALALSQPDPSSPTPKALPALNLLAEINLELGDADEARTYFLQAASLDPDGTTPEADGGGAEKFLWLAQLSEEGGHDSVHWFEKGAEILRRDTSTLLDESLLLEKRKKLAGALCGIIELYMTDLSWDPSAEPTCESLITEALLTCPSSPEPLQTLASIRISQQRIPEAKSALGGSMQLWRNLPPEHTSVPDFPTRISLARLLMEVALEDEALEVLERLVGEDDGSVEAWYLGGWCLYLSGVAKKDDPQNGGDDDEGDWKALWVESRDWLQNALKLYEMVEYEDERLREHAVELVGEIGGVVGNIGGLVVEGDEGDEELGMGEEEWESEGEEGEENDDDDGDDDEMHDV